MSITCAAYDASFAKLVSLVAHRDSNRSEKQRILRDQSVGWLDSFFLNSVRERLGTIRIVLEHFVSDWDRLGAVWSVLGACVGSVREAFGSVLGILCLFVGGEGGGGVGTVFGVFWVRLGVYHCRYI